MHGAEADQRLRRADAADARPQPDYDPKTDSKAARESLPDRFEFTIDPNVSDIVDRIAAGELEDENSSSIPPQALGRYSSEPTCGSTCT